MGKKEFDAIVSQLLDEGCKNVFKEKKQRGEKIKDLNQQFK